MIEWGQKSKPNKVPRASNKTRKKFQTQNEPSKKSLAGFLSLRNFQKVLNDITRIIPPKNPYFNQATPKKYLPSFPIQKNPLIIAFTWNPEYSMGLSFTDTTFSALLCIRQTWKKTWCHAYRYQLPCKYLCPERGRLYSCCCDISLWIFERGLRAWPSSFSWSVYWSDNQEGFNILRW